MIIPVFNSGQYTGEDGYQTPETQMYNDQMNNVLRNGLSDNGWTLPVVTQAQLAAIFASTGVNGMPNGTIWAVADPAINPTYNEIVVKLDDGTGMGTSALYKLTKTAYP
jgi:hypothetical protein